MGISPVTLDVSNLPAFSGGNDASGNDTSGFLSGLGDLFAGVGSAVSSGLKAANLPAGPTQSGWIFNPSTGGYYNPATGQALTSTGTITSAAGLPVLQSSPIFLLLFAVVAFILFRPKKS